MKLPLDKIFIGLLTLSLFHCAGENSSSTAGATFDRSLQGGSTTTADRSTEAFNDPATNLSKLELQLHDFGNDQFEAIFVAQGKANLGLGPTFNHNSCAACHIGNGRGAAQMDATAPGSQLLVRVSIPGGVPRVPGAPGDVPGIGTQIQDHAITGATPEATVSVTYVETPGTYADGTAYSLRTPQLTITPTGAALPADLQTSLRLAPPVFGLGLLEAIPDEVLESLADPDDLNGDGISGRVNHVWDDLAGKPAIGRFGRKANTANLLVQAAAAYFNDMGISNPLFMGSDVVPDIDQDVLNGAAFYTASLAVPRAVQVTDPRVMHGEFLFKKMNCVGCHVQTLLTGPSKISPALSFQQIFPYSDLLLHDMGEGLADHRPDFEASGSEWKTPPLWGLGVTEIILGSESTYLHDGRARTLEEAILWHGGEAEKAKESFRTLNEKDRQALLAFLRSL